MTDEEQYAADRAAHAKLVHAVVPLNLCVNVDEVKSELRKRGATGLRCSACDCPVSNYLHASVPADYTVEVVDGPEDDDVSRMGLIAELRGREGRLVRGPGWQVPLGAATITFIARFDVGDDPSYAEFDAGHGLGHKL